MQASTLTESCPITRDLLEKWIQRWGCSASEAILEAGCNFFTDPEIPGCIGYRIDSQYAIAYGDPICAPENASLLTEAFHRFCLEKKLNIAFMIVSESFGRWAQKFFQGTAIQIGEELIFNPQLDTKERKEGARLRNKINHAKRLGLNVNEYCVPDTGVEESIKHLQNEWLQARRGPQVSLGKIDFFLARLGKRWFYVLDGNEIIAAALLSRLDAFQGWLLKYSITHPKAPRGTSELLISSILEVLSKENCNFLTYGMVPAENLKEILGLKVFTKRLLQFVYKITKWVFRLGQRKLFWQKFHPHAKSAYMVFSRSKFGLAEINAIIKSLNVKC